MSKPKTKRTGKRTSRCLHGVVGRMNRLSIRFNGEEIIGATVSCECPKNIEEKTALLRKLLAMREAPDVADPEVLGKYSPNGVEIEDVCIPCVVKHRYRVHLPSIRREEEFIFMLMMVFALCAGFRLAIEYFATLL